ncbi:MAG: hypothetical protein ACLFWB_06830, partial [Armatimonadota bacterium]
MINVNETLHTRIDEIVDSAEPRMTYEDFEGTVGEWQTALRTELTDLLAVGYPDNYMPQAEEISSRDMG